LPETLLSVLA